MQGPHRRVGRDLDRVVKLLITPIEPLEQSGLASRSYRKPAIHVPIDVEDDSVIIYLLLPENFILRAIEQLYLSG